MPEDQGKPVPVPIVEDELFSIRFALKAREYFSVLLWEYIMSGKCIQNTLIGLLLWALFIVNIINGSIRLNDVTMILACVFVLFPGFYFLLINPIRVFRATRAVYGTKSKELNEITYHFYKDAYLMETTPEITSKRVDWKDLAKIKVMPNAYLLYYSRRAVHVIPKKVFAGDKGKKDMMKDLLRDAKSQMKKR